MFPPCGRITLRRDCLLFLLSYGTLKLYGEEFLSLDRKLHRELVHDLFGITVHYQTYRLLCGNAALIAVEQLILRDL